MHDGLLPFLTTVRRLSSAARRRRVVLLGWYGSGNTGDEAVLEAIANTLRERGVSDLHALSIDPQKTARCLGIASSPRNLANLRTLRALRGAKALVLGGGGLIQDRTSVYNLPIYALYVLLARLFGLKVVGWGLGVEPLDTLLGKLLARFICMSTAYFSVRDEGSKKLLVRAGVSPPGITVSADPAFLLVEERPDSNSQREQPLVMFCLRDLPDNRPGLNLHYLLPIGLRRRLGIGSEQHNERTQAFVETVARAVRLCVEEFGARVCFLPLWPGRDDEMTEAVIEAAQRLGVPASAMGVVDGATRPRGVATSVGEADLLVSMRLHALIFAACQGVPMLALAYARKMRGLMRSLDADRWVVEVEESNPSIEELETVLRQLWTSRSQQSAAIRTAALRLRDRASQDADLIARLLT